MYFRYIDMTGTLSLLKHCPIYADDHLASKGGAVDFSLQIISFFYMKSSINIFLIYFCFR